MAVVAAVVALSARLPDPATVPDGPLLHFRESYALLDGKRNGNPQVYKPNIYMRVGADSGRKVLVIKQDTNII